MHIVQLWYVWLACFLVTVAGGFLCLYWAFRKFDEEDHVGMKIVGAVFLFFAATIFGMLLALSGIGDVISWVAHPQR